MNRILSSILSIGVASILVTMATFAVFSASASNTGNVFSTGTLNLSTSPSTGFIQMSGMKPGDSQNSSLQVNNTGSLALNYDASVSQTGDIDLYNALELKIGTSSGGSDLYNGLLSGFSGFIGGNRNILSGNSETLFFIVTLPSTAGDALQGKTTNISFTFTATQ